jgi:hypothetical protein
MTYSQIWIQADIIRFSAELKELYTLFTLAFQNIPSFFFQQTTQLNEEFSYLFYIRYFF